jgi:diguanylate cyclase (GGDEF)-like protein/PAS domain S-box-containing protein
VQATFRLAVDGAREAFLMIQPTYYADGRIDQLLIEDCNERAAEMSGYPRNKLIGKCCTELYQGLAHHNVLDFFARVLKEGFVEDEYHVAHGRRHTPGWFQRRAVHSGLGVAMTIRDVSEAKQQAETLATMARTDSLTGLPNRHWLNDYLPGAIARARAGGHKLALYYIDIDNFKDINDSLGHKSGDEVLCAIGKGLSVAVREGDHLARIGGDEFLAVIEDLSDYDAARRIASKLIEAMNLEDTVMPWRGFIPKASVGVSVFPDDGQDMDTLLQSADIAMYQAKSEGKSRFCFYNEEFAQQVRDRISTERALELAIANDEFVIYYQPRADSRSGLLSSMEALVRWRHPQRGLVAPVEFIHVAEQSRLIVPLGDLVIRKVCEQLVQWREAGLTLRPVSVNVSALQLQGDGLRLALAANLGRFSLPSSLIAIELTESSMLEEGGNGFEELRRLREMGVELQIDDFGTGYSSLSKLQSLDIDVVKIDQSFVYKLATDHQSRALCEAVVSIGRSLDIDVVAEGVETAEQLQLLQQMGCDEIQGYLISRPLPADQIPALMDKKFF